jgi:hypothetical protein
VTNFPTLLSISFIALALAGPIQTTGCNSDVPVEECPVVSQPEQDARNAVCWEYCSWTENRCPWPEDRPYEDWVWACVDDCKTKCPGEGACVLPLPETPPYSEP